MPKLKIWLDTLSSQLIDLESFLKRKLKVAPLHLKLLIYSSLDRRKLNFVSSIREVH